MQKQNKFSIKFKLAHQSAVKPAHISRRAVVRPISTPLCIGLSSALASLAAATPAIAQHSGKNLDDVTISSSPFRETLQNQVAPTLILQRNELQSRMDANLGTLLEQESGIASSGHGPNAGRPIIRGLSNDRVKILNNGSSVFDASNSSEDHAVAINPIFADRIEVLRGAATLRYGGNAIGGAVNVIDDRTPVAIGNGQHGEARFSGRLGSAQDTAAAHYAIGRDNFALSVDAFDIRTGDVKVPGEFFSANGLSRAQEEDPAATNRTGKLPNSSARTDGGSIGGALRGSWGYAGISIQQLNNNYGIGNAASDEQPRIDLKQDRAEFKGRLNLSGFFQSVDLDAVNSRYRHSELVDEGSGVVPEVTFRNKGDEIRMEGLTRSFGATRGTIGFQRSNSRLNAFNDEGNNTFLPNTRTTGDALYATALTQTGRIQLNGGLRHEDHRVRGDLRGECGDIAAADRKLNLNSASLGARLPVNAENSVSLQFNHSERAPTVVELFACGKHEATFNAQYGNPNLPKEKANGVDLSWAFKTTQWNNRATVYQQDFSNFITLRADPGAEPTMMNPDGPRALQNGLTAFDYASTKATIRGAELSAIRTLEGKTFGLTDAYTPTLELRFDHTRGTDDNTGRPLPRITPQRITLAAALSHAKGYARLQIVNHSAQNRISAEDESRTDGYTRIDAYAAYRPSWNLGATRTEFFLQGRNLTDTKGRNHVSFLKDFIPVQGRTVTAGVRFLF